MPSNFPINPRVRACGKARLDLAQRIQTTDDWHKLWVQPSNPFPFVWGAAWKHCVEYKVADFPAEVGFFIDILALEVYAINPSYAMFTSPDGEFYLAVVPALPGEVPTPASALSLGFMLADLLATTGELQQRGIVFEDLPHPCEPGSPLWFSTFRTPNGIFINLWGMVDQAEAPEWGQSDFDYSDLRSDLPGEGIPSPADPNPSQLLLETPGFTLGTEPPQEVIASPIPRNQRDASEGVDRSDEGYQGRDGNNGTADDDEEGDLDQEEGELDGDEVGEDGEEDDRDEDEVRQDETDEDDEDDEDGYNGDRYDDDDDDDDDEDDDDDDDDDLDDEVDDHQSNDKKNVLTPEYVDLESA